MLFLRNLLFRNRYKTVLLISLIVTYIYLNYKTLSSSGSNKGKKPKAVILILCRNSDLTGLTTTLHQFESTFNSKYKYPYLFLNDVEFTPQFKATVRTLISSATTFALTGDSWSVPSSVNLTKFSTNMANLAKLNVPYATLKSYHQMCRYFSGPVFLHPQLLQYDYYWRLEPNVSFYCRLDYDPIQFLSDTKKIYGFSIILKEIEATVPSLFNYTLQFMKSKLKPGTFTTDLFPLFLGQITDDNDKDKLNLKSGKSFASGKFEYNLCHFWTNFEILYLPFFRSTTYQSYFQYLDATDNFFYERWGDAPVRSLALSLAVNFDQIHQFRDIGYRHDKFFTCPRNTIVEQSVNERCDCPEANDEDLFDVDTLDGSCGSRFRWYNKRRIDLNKVEFV